MPPSHATAVQDIVADMIRASDPEVPLLLETAGRMNDGFYPAWLVDAVSQKHRGRFDHHDAYCFLRILQHFYTGELLYGSVKVGEGPNADEATDLNNAILGRLPAHYTATFIGRSGDNDGSLSWSEPINLFSTVLNLDDDTEATTKVVVAPQRIPLEVGTTAASRTVVHLRMDGGLARWPYGSNDIHILVLREEVLQARRDRCEARTLE